MGKPNRKHRAAKQRAQQSAAEFWAAVGIPEDREATAAEIGNAITAAALQSARSGARGKTARGDAIVAERFGALFAGLPASVVEHGTQLAGQHIIASVFRNGWLPSDIAQAAQRRGDTFVVEFLTDVIAAYVRPFAPDTIDETWRAQLSELGAEVWWSDSATHLSQWSVKQMLTIEEALTTVIAALALLLLLPKMESIRPLPGAARPQSVPHHVDEKVLGRVRGLLAKAESTSFPEEAEALSAKAQELMTKYALDRVLVDADTSAVDLPGARRIWLDTPYTDAKALLIDAVAKANRSRAIFVAEWGFVTIVGDETDLDAVELLSTSLLVQATRAMIAIDINATGTDARTFRKAFLVAYATRIGERLAAATAATIAQSATPERLLPVLASHQLAVDNAFETLFPQSRSRGITIRSAEGWDAGRAAADRARLDSRRGLER
ncbi:DUF2786 domain-containing protein [Nocardia sp. NBC_01503]|uniref:DUF2786 domain-containing protein n=1 Tax=Nocardia sp. NBC_01503 TaxID=2975997 RepID=UPI002E7C38DF|nr:DUF2786 domain-containing protein [Nocardia sp. NBC_01503]WTL32169.1 DUF2786 domain-containing protein [Nocardia sp. NBC_01503]